MDKIEVSTNPIWILNILDLLFLISLPIVIEDVKVKLSIVDITIDNRDMIKIVFKKGGKTKLDRAK